MNGLVLSMSRKKGLPGNKIILLEKRSSSLGSTQTTPHPRASPPEYWHSDTLTASMAAVAHESLAEDEMEILRRADELKKAFSLFSNIVSGLSRDLTRYDLSEMHICSTRNAVLLVLNHQCQLAQGLIWRHTIHTCPHTSRSASY